MEILLIADLHAHNFEAFATTLPNGRNSRLQEILNTLGEVYTYCQEHPIDAVFMLGDVFHSRTKIDVDVLQGTYEAWESIAGAVQETFFLVGNHDQHSKDGKIHSLEVFRQIPNTTIIDQPMLRCISNGEKELRFAAHPFTVDIDSWKRFNSLLPSNVDLYLFHQGLSEAAVGAFDITIKADIALSDFPTDKALICRGGHYHKRQFLLDGKVGYVGSPLQHSFGERNEPKGFTHLTWSGEEFTEERFIRTSAARFRLVEFGEEMLVEPTDHVKVRCKSDEIEKVKILLPNAQIDVVSQEDYEEKRIDESILGSDRKVLEAYVEQTQTDGMNPTRLLQLGMGLLKE